jgi:DNA-binding MarR family transcriptional regulator
MAYDQLKLENQLCFPFYAASRLIIRAYQEDLDALGITYPQYLVMMVLWEKEETTVNAIAEKLILNTNTITPLLKRMETMGLITRTPSKTDQRKVLVGLTEDGIKMREKAAEIPYRLLQRLKIEPSEQGLQDFINLKGQLYSLIELLDKHSK